MKHWKTGTVICFMLLATRLFGQSLSLSVSTKSMGAQDVVQATYSYKDLDGAKQPSPGFTDWNVVSTGSSQSSIFSNGHASSSIDYVFSLLPKRTGNLTIPGITVTVNGKRYSCAGVTVKVEKKAHSSSANSSQGSSVGSSPFASLFQNMLPDDNDLFQRPASDIVVRPGQTIQDAVKGRFLIRIILSKKSCYVGEPILADYVFYSSAACSATPSGFPVFSSFSVTDVNQQPYPYNAQLNGKNYRVQSIRKVQLVPLKSGDLILDPASVNCQAGYVEAGALQDLRTANILIKGDAETIHVLPLPDKGRPADFSGAVGNFSIMAQVDKNRLPAQDNNNLHIQISGTGSLDGASLPDIRWPKDIQAYDSRDSQTVDKSQFPMPKTLAFDIPFIGNAKGTAVIPPIHFSYFDTQKDAYTTISTDSIQLAFSAPVATNLLQFADSGDNSLYLIWIAIAGGIVCILLAFWIIVRRLRSKRKKATLAQSDSDKDLEKNTISDVSASENQQRIQAIHQVEESPLQKKERLYEAIADLEHESDSKQFFVLAKALLIQMLQDKLQSRSSEDEELLPLLQSAYPEEYNSYRQLFTRCNKALYLPVSSAVEHDEVLKRIKILAR